MEKEPIAADKVHVLVVPFPAQGHINPMLEFSKRLVSKGVNVTLANTRSINKAMKAEPLCLIRYETISDGFDELGFAQAESTAAYVSSLKLVGSQTLASLIKKLDDSGCPVTAIIYDGFLPWALDVARQFGLVGVVFFTQSCAVNNIYYHVQRGLLPLPIKGTTLSLPGLPILELWETPSFIHDLRTYPDFYDLIVLGQFVNVDEADVVLFSSFYELEEEVVDQMVKRSRLLLTVGPTLPSMYLDKRLEDDKDYSISMFEPKVSTCMNWLQGKPSDSVVYVSFGSMADLGAEQTNEIALGLKEGKYYFLWVVRETEQAKLPNNFIDEISQKGLVVTWSPQLEVLAHESIGCFLTHCGLNSVVEGLCLGVPMVAIPQWTDQPTNAKYVEDVWKVGIRARPDEKGIVRREMVELCLKEVMEGEKGKEIKENSIRWKNLAKEAIDEGGSSDRNIDEFVAKLVSFGSSSVVKLGGGGDLADLEYGQPQFRTKHTGETTIYSTS